MITAETPARNIDLLESRVPVPESLRPWLTDLGRIPTVTDLQGAFVYIPQAMTSVVLRTEALGRTEAFVVGPQTRASYSKADKPGDCLRIRLAPGTARQLLGVRAAELADGVFPLADMPGAVGVLANELTHRPTADMLSFLEEALPQHISETETQRSHRRLLRNAVDAIGAGTTTAIPDLAAELTVSERQLRNLFATGIGVSPKHFERICRVRGILVRAGTTPWAEVAATAGYYDQSHLSADFRSLMGVPPATFFRGELPAPTACRGPNR
ncbi:AraC family transcriptional regulator [Nocardia cyriacigeorgica]|uniref:AraC family transcriptional regulator n=1 Tax=Nocardia cyriacigeorgica TaxID=135487 RepID=A0A6P1D4X5_9NOCA|nr:helix-turn-helix domain-containing protein [Nocardia cyriacigeorgica]NEW39800.1 AraC family transcriptional regulator [Nocardia cyriacigeorgica]NEW45527.1 AraC family transcriptional regulator [Nocardia cyriacigeorgica]NEW52434.1 AraC family transcriptional regulator [Nocardia cyriacigeorgica]NEW58643.1 AraC family transcriptional regulator [Nocardia cyriacigeorgica]